MQKKETPGTRLSLSGTHNPSWLHRPRSISSIVYRDLSIAFEHIVLAAANFGLGTCWIGKPGFDETLKEVLSIPEHMKVLAVTPLDYPAETPGPKARKPLSEIVYYEYDTAPNGESN